MVVLKKDDLFYTSVKVENLNYNVILNSYITKVNRVREFFKIREGCKNLQTAYNNSIKSRKIITEEDVFIFYIKSLKIINVLERAYEIACLKPPADLKTMKYIYSITNITPAEKSLKIAATSEAIYEFERGAINKLEEMERKIYEISAKIILTICKKKFNI